MSANCMEADVSAMSPLRCGRKINRAFFPENITDLQNICKEISSDEYVLLGNMTNTLILGGYEGSAIFCEEIKGININGEKLTVRAGEKISAICGVAQYAGLGGLESFYGLPGTVGGALSGNAGCFGCEISEAIEKITVFNTEECEFEELTKEEIAFGYRYCNLRKNKDLVYEVTFDLYKKSPVLIAGQMAEVRRQRRIKQPKGRSLGSFFKQYNGISAGYYIEKAGLKGYERNGVTVSPVHANFFINEKGSAEDYYDLGEYVKKTVQDKFGITLEREVVVIGEKRI